LPKRIYKRLPSVAGEAAGIVAHRRRIYGDPTPNLQQTADLWTVIFRRHLKPGAAFTAADVSQAQRLVKESRLSETPNHRDSLRDVCGYADCQAIITNAKD
jgi:hypothetical protein